MSMTPVELNLESSPKSLQGFFNEYELIEVRTNNEVTDNSQVFTIVTKNTTDYTNLHECYISCEFQIKTVADADTGLNVCAIRNGIASLFSRITVRIGGQVVEVVERPDLAVAIRNIQLYSQDYAVMATNHVYHKNNGDLTATTGNPGYVARAKRTQGGALACAYIALHELIGIASVDKLLVNQEVSLEFNKNNDNELLHRAGDDQGVDCKLLVKRLSLWMPRIVLAPSADLVIKQAISGGVQSPFMFHSWNAYVSPNLTGNSGTYRVITTAEEVDYAYVIQRTSAKAQYTAAAHTYLGSGASQWRSCEVSLNGRRYPAQRFTDLDSERGLSRAYASLVRCGNKKMDYSNGMDLSFEEFAADRCVLAFDLTAKAANWSKGSSTIEVHYDLEAGNGKEMMVVLVSKKGVMINYNGSSAVVSQA
jgi:hypothetical protein